MHIKSYVAILSFETQSILSTVLRLANFAQYVYANIVKPNDDNDRNLTGATATSRLKNTRRMQCLLENIGPDDFCLWASKQARKGARDADGIWMCARYLCDRSPNFPVLASALLVAFERGDTVHSLSRRSSTFLSAGERAQAIHQLRNAIEHRSPHGLALSADCCGNCQSDGPCLASAK